MATDINVPNIPLKVSLAEPPEDALARLSDVYLNRAEATALLKGWEKRFQQKGKEAENSEQLWGANDQAEACALVLKRVARYSVEKEGGLLDLGVEIEKEREKLRAAREGE